MFRETQLSAISGSSAELELFSRSACFSSPGLISLRNRGASIEYILRSGPEELFGFVGKDSKLYTDASSTVIYDPGTNDIAYSTLSQLGKVTLPRKLTSILSISETQLTYWSQPAGVVACQEFTSSGEFPSSEAILAYTNDTPMRFTNGWYADGILGIGDNRFPIDALLSSDPTLTPGMIFSSLYTELTHKFLPSLPETLMDSKTFVSRGSSLNFSADPSGRYLLIEFTGLSSKIDACVVDLHEYFLNRGAGFFEHSVLLKLSDIDRLGSSRHIHPYLDGFLIVSVQNGQHFGYLVDTNILSGLVGEEAVSVPSFRFNSTPVFVSGDSSELYFSSDREHVYKVVSSRQYPSSSVAFTTELEDGRIRLRSGSISGNTPFTKLSGELSPLMIANTLLCGKSTTYATEIYASVYEKRTKELKCRSYKDSHDFVSTLKNAGFFRTETHKLELSSAAPLTFFSSSDLVAIGSKPIHLSQVPSVPISLLTLKRSLGSESVTATKKLSSGRKS